MAPEKAPAFQFYPKDYLSDHRVRSMSFEQRGLYWEAICICWLEGSLPADQAELAAILGCPRKRIAKIWPVILRCFDQHGDRLLHKRLDKERAAQSESRRRRTDAAQKRWEKEQKPDAMHMQSNTAEQSPVDAKQCSPSSSPSASSTSSPTAVNTVAPLHVQPLISGESNPRTWGKIHGEHVPGFCDWVCLPDFIFDEFCRKSGKDPAKDYVRDWALRVRERYQGAAIGDNLKFWRERWSESHVIAPEKPQHKPFSIEEAMANEAKRKAERIAKGATR